MLVFKAALPVITERFQRLALFLVSIMAFLTAAERSLCRKGWTVGQEGYRVQTVPIRSKVSCLIRTELSREHEAGCSGLVHLSLLPLSLHLRFHFSSLHPNLLGEAQGDLTAPINHVNRSGFCLHFPSCCHQLPAPWGAASSPGLMMLRLEEQSCEGGNETSAEEPHNRTN